MKNMLQGMKDINVLENVVTIKSTMKEENREQLKEMAKEILEK